MSTILIAGDSWGIGTYVQNGDKWDPTGQGIQSILEGLGHTVINISKGGGSNWLMIDRLEDRWGNFSRCKYGVDPTERKDIAWNKVDHVVFLQTDIFREQFLYEEAIGWQKVLDHDFAKSLLKYDSLEQMIDEYFLKFYTALNSIGQRHNKKILCLGCWSRLHPSIINYSNLISVIPSAVQFLLPQLEEDVYLSDPEWYSQLANDPTFMDKFGAEFKTMTIHATNKLELLYSTWHEVHPDIDGYQQIVDVLVKKV